MTLNNFLRGGAIIGIFLVPFIPLVVSATMFFPFITGKNFTFRIIVEIVFALWLILALRDPAYRPKRSPVLTALFVFLAVIGLADILGVDPSKSFWSNFERMEGYVTLLHLIGYFLAASAILDTDKLWKRFFHVSLFVSAIIGIYGIFQLSGALTINQGGVRLDATFGNATYLAIYMFFHLFLAGFYLARHRGARWVSYTYGALILFQLFILIETASRGVVLGLVTGSVIAVALVAFSGRTTHRVRISAAGVLVGLLIIVGVFFALKDVPSVRQHPILGRFATISLSEGSSRFLVWNMAWEGFKEHPILGWGQDNFGAVFDKHYDPAMYSQEPWFDRTHNIVFDWLIAGGILGLLAYLGISVALFITLTRNPEGVFTTTEKALFAGLIVGYIFQLLFVFDNITSYILFFSLLAFVHARAGTAHHGRFWEKLSGGKEIVERVWAPIILIACVLIIYAANVRGVLAAKTLIQAISPQAGGASDNLSLFRRAITMHPIGRTEAREQLLQFSLQATGIDGVEDSIKTEAITATENEMRQEMKESSYTARPAYFLGSFYRRLGRREDAITFLAQAGKISPRKQQVAVEHALTLIDEERYADAAAIVEPLFQMEPRDTATRYVFAVTQIFLRNEERVNDIMAAEVEKYGAPVAPDDAFVRAYFEIGAHEYIVRIWEIRVENDPTNIQYHLSLAAAYLNAGKGTKAIEQVESIIEMEPDFRERGEQIISDIRAGRHPEE